MTPGECAFESEVLAAVIQGWWPARVDLELREHASACATCREVAAIAVAIEGDRDELRAAAAIPDSAHAWRLAQVRARSEAAQAAGRPILAAQLFALTCAVALLWSSFSRISFSRGWTWLMPSASALFAEHSALVLAMAILLFVVPTAVCLAIGRDRS